MKITTKDLRSIRRNDMLIRTARYLLAMILFIPYVVLSIPATIIGIPFVFVIESVRWVRNGGKNDFFDNFFWFFKGIDKFDDLFNALREKNAHVLSSCATCKHYCDNKYGGICSNYETPLFPKSASCADRLECYVDNEKE